MSKAIAAYVNVYTHKIGVTAFKTHEEARRNRCPNSVFVGAVKIERCPVSGKIIMEVLKDRVNKCR